MVVMVLSLIVGVSFVGCAFAEGILAVLENYK